MNPKRFLIVERAPWAAQSLVEVLTERGHAVQWVDRIVALNPMVGLTNTGEEVAINECDIALVDDLTDLKPLNGASICKQLRRNSICIAMSCQKAGNAEMLSNGARAACHKAVLLNAVITDSVQLEQLRPEEIQPAIDAYEPLSRTEAQRKKAEAVVHKYL